MPDGEQGAVRVLHVASHRINVGDGALIAVIQRGLRSVAAANVDYHDFDIVDVEPKYGGTSLADLDFGPYQLVLVGGGGTIDNKRSHDASGMAFPLSGDSIRRLEIPIVYVALGYNLFSGTRLRNTDALRDVIRACAERRFPFSVRNDGSLARLRAALGPVADTVMEVPDPAFFMEIDDAHIVPEFSGRRPRILVQVAGDNLGFRFSRGGAAGDLWGRVRNRLPVGLCAYLVAQISDLVRWLVESFDAEVVLAPHIAPDLPLVSGILQGLPAQIRRKRVRVLGIPDPSRAPQFFAAYAGADLVVGMRGHSVIGAVGLRTPCVALSSHPKVAGFMESCGLGDWVVQYGKGMAGELRRLSGELLADPSNQLARRDAETAGFRSRFDAFLQRCWAVVGEERSG